MLMSYIDLYRRKSGGAIKDSHYTTNVNFVNNTFVDSLSHLIVTIEDIRHDARFIIKREYNASSKYEAEMLLFRPNTKVYRGQIAEFRDNKWLIFYVDDRELLPKGYIRMCNKTLKFENGNQYPCVVDTNIRDYQLIKDLTNVNLMADAMKVMVTSNEDTWKIRETDRFVFDGLAWEVQGVDKTVYTINQEGVIEFAIRQVPLNEEEKSEIEKDIVPEFDYHINILGVSETLVNSNCQFTTQLYKDGILDNGHHVVSWSATSGSIASDGYFIAPNVKGSIIISATYQYINLDGTYGYIEDKKEIQILDDSWEW